MGWHNGPKPHETAFLSRRFAERCGDMCGKMCPLHGPTIRWWIFPSPTSLRPGCWASRNNRMGQNRWSFAWQKGWPCAWLADIFSWQQWLPQEAGLWQDETVCGRVFTKAGRVKTIGWLNCFKNIGGAVRLRTNSADMVLLHWPGRWLSSDAQSNFPAAVFVMIHVSMNNACFTGNRKLREESWKALTHLQQDLMWIYLAAASLFESLWHMREEYGRFNLRPQTSCFFDCLQTWKSLDSSFLDTEGLLFHFHVWIVLTVSS